MFMLNTLFESESESESATAVAAYDSLLVNTSDIWLSRRDRRFLIDISAEYRSFGRFVSFTATNTNGRNSASENCWSMALTAVIMSLTSLLLALLLRRS